MNTSFDRWKFIEKWLPDYSSNQYVAYSNDLDCYIHGQTENSQYYRLKEKFPDVNDAIIEQEAVDSGLFKEAYMNYTQVKEEELEKKRRDAEDSRLSFNVGIKLTFENENYLTVKADTEAEAIEIAKRITADMLGHIDGYCLEKIEVNSIDIV